MICNVLVTQTSNRKSCLSLVTTTIAIILSVVIVSLQLNIAPAHSQAIRLKLKPQQQRQLETTQQQLKSSTTNSDNKKSQILEDGQKSRDEVGDEVHLLGLFDLHQQSSARAPFKCGPIELDAGEQSSRRPMQNMMAFLWAIEQVNSDSSLLPGVKLQARVMDTCSSFLRTNQQLANLLHTDSSHHGANQAKPQQQPIAIVADQHDWQSVEATVSMASALGITTFVSQSRSSRLAEFARQYARQASQHEAELISGVPNTPAAVGVSSPNRDDERLLGELLGIGRMMTTSPLDTSGDLEAEHQQQVTNQRNRPLMVRMLLNNELIADALASFCCDQMKWDLLSVIYEPNELDLVDLHDELIKQLFLRNAQLALDEPLHLRGVAITNTSTSEQLIENLLLKLARKAQFGARAVITLLSTNGARQMQVGLQKLRQKLLESSDSSASSQLANLNSLIWITNSDREPYYAHAIDSLGLISLASGTSSLMAEFKLFYDNHEMGLASNTTTSSLLHTNLCWPEFLKAILIGRRQKAGDPLELVANECSKWLEPSNSPLNEKCRALTLSSLVELERKAEKITTASKPKLGKYLAGGWEHNGMSVINSVLAIANGLESIRQALCPELASGLCSQMRALLAQPQQQTPRPQQDQSISGSGELPTLSELLYGELTRSTFQLADGQMFSLDDGGGASSSAPNGVDLSLLPPPPPPPQVQQPATQLEGRVKFYNLRFLRQNLIGFVKFAQFDQHDGLTLSGALTTGNQTAAANAEALHYPALPSDFSKQVPLNQLQSTCLDETKCLMLGALLGGGGGGGEAFEGSSANATSGRHSTPTKPLNEEELAEGVNSLFKLDHPLISGAGQQPQPLLSGGQKVVSSEQLRTLLEGAEPGASGELEFVRTMRARLPVAGEWPASAFDVDEQQQQQKAGRKLNNNNKASSRRQFEVIVLLPLHDVGQGSGGNGGEYSAASSAKSTAASAECSGAPIERAHAFQQLAALAYAQTMLVEEGGRRRKQPSAEQPPSATSGGVQRDGLPSAMANSSVRATTKTTTDDKEEEEEEVASKEEDDEQRVELIVSVIDYCGQIDLIERRLMGKLAQAQSQAQRPQLVALVDFDARASKQVSRLLLKRQRQSSTSALDWPSKLLHLTLAANRPIARNEDDDADGDEETGKLGAAAPAGLQTLRLNLLPSKAHEIEALVRLIRSMANYRLVHLIYADKHEYRDEFIRRANEANICVSKLIFMPQAAASVDSNAADDIAQKQLEATRRLFERELYDYSSAAAARINSTATNQDDGLNETRVLVVLASENQRTNQLLLEAASKSMLNDYVWITTHEWLSSVELPLEQSAAKNFASNENVPGAIVLPRHFFATRLESVQGHNFKHFLSHLTPALHAPLPTDWFDEFWQQHFRCRLPLPGALSRGIGLNDSTSAGAVWPLCQPHQRLEASQIIEDDLVPYTMRALESLHVALEKSAPDDTHPKSSNWHATLARDFRHAFDGGHLAAEAGASRLAAKAEASALASPLIGFHIVHRLLVATSGGQQFDTQTGRRANSRKLSPSSQGNRLVRVGLWRPTGASANRTDSKRRKVELAESGGLTLLPASAKQFVAAAPTISANTILNGRKAVQRADLSQTTNTTTTDESERDTSEDAEEFRAISWSLERVAGIKSRCATEQSCALCRRQIGQTLALIKQEEAKLSLSSGGSTSFISAVKNVVAPPTQPQVVSSSLDKPSRLDSNFYDGENEAGDELAADAATAAGNELDREQQRRRQRARDRADELMSATRSGRKSTGAGSNLDDIQAAASSASLFEARVSERVASDTRRAYQQLLTHTKLGHTHRTQEGSSGLQAAFGQYAGALMSILSLVGIAFTVASMTYFYPNMRDYHARRPLASKLHGSSFRSTASSTCNIIGSSCDDQNELALDSASNIVVASRKSSSSTSFLGALADDLNDYLMLIGLLMLYSINIAFLLPATVSVCSFRRLGLAISYTLLFSAILVRIFDMLRQQTNHSRSGGDPTASSSLIANGDRKRRKVKNKKNSSAPSRPALQANQRQLSTSETAWNSHGQPLESVDESVEVTFESLPHEDGSGVVEDCEPSYQQPSAASQQVSTLSDIGGSGGGSVEELGATGTQNNFFKNQEAGDDLKMATRTSSHLQLPLLMLLLQFVISFGWLIKQPPEPTLFLGCWHCSSPLRSSSWLLFLYEPLLSLLQPAALLLISWLASISLLRRTTSNEQQFKQATRRFLASQPLSFTISNNPAYAKLKERQFQLGQQWRESCALLMTSTLLVLTWFLLALSTISLANSALQPRRPQMPSNGAAYFGPTITNGPAGNWPPQVTRLVCANLLSGAIIFSLLFVYRLNLFNHRSTSSSFKRSNSLKHLNEHKLSSSCRNCNLLTCCLPSCASPNSSSLPSSAMRLFKSRSGSRTFALTTATTTASTADQQGDVLAFNTIDGQTPTRIGLPGQERLKLQQFNNTYGTYATLRIGENSSQHHEGSFIEQQQQQAAPSNRVKRNKSNASQKKEANSKRSLLSKLASTNSGRKHKNQQDQKAGDTQPVAGKRAHGRFERRQSNGSVASSTTKLVSGNNQMMAHESDQSDASSLVDFDTISCAMSVASNSTSQLQGNDLYPIDCSIQLADGAATAASAHPQQRES